MFSSPQNPPWVSEGFVVPREVVEERLRRHRTENPGVMLSAKNVVRRLDVPLNEQDFVLVQQIARDARYCISQTLVIISPEQGFALVSRDQLEQPSGRQRKAFFSPDAPPCTIFIPEIN